jgi:hypothetical protein
MNTGNTSNYKHSPGWLEATSRLVNVACRTREVLDAAALLLKAVEDENAARHRYPGGPGIGSGNR